MAGIKASLWLSFACIFLHVHDSKAQDSGLSAVTETNQEISGYGDTVENWVHSGRPGLFITDDFDRTENSTFQIKKGGVYYVSANLIIETKSGPYYYYSYYSSATFQGEIHLRSDNGYVDYNKHLSTYVTMGKYEQKNLRISGYIQLDEGWKVSVQLGYNYGWKRTIKAGSTLSLMYVSNPYMFPGVLLKNDYEYLHLESPSYSSNVVDWNEIDEGSAFPMSEGNIMIPHDGLYHVLVNLNIRRYTDITIDFGIMINNKTEAIRKRTKIDSQGRNTIILEGILNLKAKQIISIKISNPDSYYTYIRVDSSSTFFIFSKGTLSDFTPALSTHYKSTSTKLPANRFSRLSNWDTTSTQSLDHYKNVELKQGEFVAPKSGIYQVNMALYLSNCTTAVVKILVNSSSKAISPDIGLMKESNDCYLENSLILKLATNDKLRLQVKSDVKYTVLPQTSYQVIFQTKYSLWPAAIFKLEKPFPFNTNSGGVKVHHWSHHVEHNWNDLFFQVNEENIMIPLPGLYLLSYNVIVKTTTPGAQFHSEIIVNGSKAVEGSMCLRGSAPLRSTCTTSTLINLNEKTNLTLHVSMKGGSKKKQSVEISDSTRLTVIFIGHTRSHPAFKLNVKIPNTAYNVKASSTDKMQSLTEYTLPNTSFFQSGPIYSSKAKTFHGGQNISFLLLNNVKFDLQNDGYLASVVGSKNSNMMVYSKDHKHSHFSLSAFDVNPDPQFYFNVSATAKKTAFKWRPEDGSVASGVYIDHKETMIYLRAQLKPETTSYCSSQWTQIANRDWNLLAHLNNLGTLSKTGMQLSRSGFYLTSLNLAVTANTSNTVIDVAIFADKEIVLSASETSPADGKFSIFLQGVVEAVRGQHIEIKVKCTNSTEFTFANGGGISVVKIDEQQSSPGMRKRFSENYIYGDKIGSFYPRYYYRSDETLQVFRQGINNHGWRLSVARNGVYLISVVGYAHTRSHSTGGNFEIGFLSQANISENAACSLDSSPLFFKDSSNRVDESLALTGFVSLNKNEVAGFLGRYDYYTVSYSSRFYMSLQFVGDIETSNSFIAKLKQDRKLSKGQNQSFKGSWIPGKTCGQFRTRDIGSEIKNYKVLYSGYYMVAINLVLHHKDGSDFGFCFTVNGKAINVGVKNVGCFTRHLKTENHTSISTVSNSELLYLEEGKNLSVHWSTSLEITISKNSSFSVFYLGTAGAILGSSWVIQKAELTELPSFSYRYHYHYYYRYHYYDDDREYTQHIVKGWKASLNNTKMFFQNGVKTLVKDTFVSPQDGVYVVFAKLHVKGSHETNETCGVKLELAVDGAVLDFAFKDDITGTRNTLSFTTTLRLEKWQGVTVRVSWGLSQCKSMSVEPGSSFAVIYLDSGKKAFTLWPNIGPHIVEFPAEGTVYVRQDKDKYKELTCKAVGEYPITYEWKTYGDVVLNDSHILDTTTLNDSFTRVQCVATMQGLVAESTFVRIRAIDPTIIFVDTYSNRTYDLPEKNDTTTDRYQDVMIFGAREKKTGYYYWYWSRRINCSITKGDKNNAFMITYRNDYYYWGDDNQYFTLRARLIKLDREETAEYKIEITCKNLDYNDAATATTTIDIKILDANDNLPVFEKEIYKVKIPKNIQAGESILQVMATDDDSEENGKIKYSLIYSSDSYIFSIDETYGLISLKQHEILSKPVYTLTAVATDQGKPPRQAYVTVILEVQDATVPTTNHTNTNPVFPQREYIAYLIPGTPIGTVVTTVHAHDPFTFSHENIRYYLFSGDDSVFKVNTKTGKITTKGDVTEAQYLLEIAAEYVSKPGQKSGQYINTTLVIVLLRRVDKRVPNFEKPVYQVEKSERTEINSRIVQVKAVYKNTLIYTEVVNSTMFKLNRTTGEITLAGKLDYEEQKAYTLVIKANDLKVIEKVGYTTVIIHVTDDNDNAPVIYDYPRHSIRVDLSKIKNNLPYNIGYVKARDKDSGTNGEIRYYLKQDYNAFSIDSENGTLYVRGHLDCCDVVYGLTVEARDEGIPPRHDEVEISVMAFYPKTGPTTSSPSKSPPSKSPPKKSPVSSSSSDQKKYIVAGVAGGVVLIIVIVGALYWRRRRQRRNHATMSMNYMGLPSDEEDDDLLDGTSDQEDNENNARLGLISAASDDNLLRNEEPC